MAEVFNLAASVVTLTEVLGEGHGALAKLKSCYNVPPEVVRIRVEVGNKRINDKEIGIWIGIRVRIANSE